MTKNVRKKTASIGRRKFDFGGQRIQFKKDPSGVCWNAQVGQHGDLLVRLLHSRGWFGIAFTSPDLDDWHHLKLRSKHPEVRRSWESIGTTDACETPEQAVAETENIVLNYFRRLGNILGYEVER